MSAITPAHTAPGRKLSFPKPMHQQFRRTFHIQMDANELVELLEWAGQGAYSLGWPDLGKDFDDRQVRLLRRLQHENTPRYVTPE